MQKKSDLKSAIDYLDFLTSNNRYRMPSVDDQFSVAPEDNAESNHFRHRELEYPTDSGCEDTQWAQNDLTTDRSAHREPAERDATHGAERIMSSAPHACDEYQTPRLNSSVERWFTIACLLAIACGCFWYGFGGKSSDRSARVSATPTDSNSPAKFVTVPIRDVEPGQWVLAENPELTESGLELLGQIDPSAYRKYGLRMTKSDGGTLELELLRPATWLPDGTPVGESIWLDLAELGAVGEATLLSIEPCPALAERPSSRHQLVTGKFRHSSAEVLDLSIEGLSEPVGTTSSHPFWSEDRQTFVEAGSLQVGERLLTADGQRVRLTNIVRRAGPQPVYNLEVNIQHVYFVAKSGVLVHNECTAPKSVTAQLRNLRGTAKSARWAKADGPVGLRGHSGKHGHEVGATTARQYDLSARTTIQNGRRFRYRDRATNEVRTGYWDPDTGLFTATSQTRKTTAVLSHFPETWANLRKLPGFSALR